MILLHLSITIINSALMEDTASSRHENRIAPAFLTLTKAQNNGFAEQLAFWTLARHLLEEDLGKPGTTWVPDRPCGNHFSSPSPRAHGFPCEWRSLPSLYFCILKIDFPLLEDGVQEQWTGKRAWGNQRSDYASLRKEKGTFLPTEAVGLIGHMVEKDLCFSGLIGVNILD